MNAPEKVIGEIIDLIDKPQEKVDVDFKAKGAVAAYHLMPGVVGKLSGKSLAEMLRAAPPAENTSGSLYEPRLEGTGVSGDLREKLERKSNKDSQQ